MIKEILLGYEKKSTNDIVVYSNMNRYHCEIRQGSSFVGFKYFLHLDGYNGMFFNIARVNREDFFSEVFNRSVFRMGDWPWCDSPEEVITLLNALIEKSKAQSCYEEI